MRNPLHIVLIAFLCTLAAVASHARSAQPDELRARAELLRKEASVLEAQAELDGAAKLGGDADDELKSTSDLVQTKMQKVAKTKAGDKRVKALTAKVMDAGQKGAGKKLGDVAAGEAGRADGAARVKHLRTAAQHLKAAGQGELSAKVWREADLLEQRAKPVKSVGAKGPVKGTGEGAGMAAEVKALRAEVERLKAELAAMRKRAE